MSKVIIGIHGLGNKPTKRLLERWWRTSVRDGLRRIDHDRPVFTLKLVYWAGLLHPLPLNPAATGPEDPQYLGEPYLPPPDTPPHRPTEQRRKMLDFIEREMDSLFLNDDLSVNYGGITDLIIRHWFHDLDRYYRTGCTDPTDNTCPVKKIIIDRTAALLEHYRSSDIMLVGHSMGSIIAYDTLMGMTGGPLIDTFVTMGSPLGLPVIMSRIADGLPLRPAPGMKLAAPPQVTRRWCNLSDLNDKIAFNYNLADDYGPNDSGVAAEDMTVTNDYTVNGKHNPHKIYGYLRTPEFAGIVHDFLTHGRHPAVNAVAGTVQRVLARLF